LNKIFKKPFSISHTFRSMITWTQPRYWREFCLDKLRTEIRLCDGGGDVA